MKSGKLLLATLGATMLLGILTASAPAVLSTSSQTWRATFRSLTFNGVFGNITCEFSIEGSYHSRTINKVVGTLIGYVTRAILGPCREGRGTVLGEMLPWHETYVGFTGTLPNITAYRQFFINGAIRVQEPFAGCLARTSAANPGVLTFNRDTSTGAITTAEIGGTVPTSCGVEGSFSSDRGPVTVANSATRVTLTLI
ncbi:MAG TPA: hypothetical protein VFS37_16490 [Conexibacter sp.]|nr:hypothetical protein [Conexibacter sp.]